MSGLRVSKIVALLVVFLPATLFYWFLTRGDRVDSLGVLPFVSSDPETEQLSDQITAGLIQSLSQNRGLVVLPASAVSRYKGQKFNLRELGRDLKVKAVLAGRLERRGAEVRVSTELVSLSNQRRLWGRVYSHKPAEVLAARDEILKDLSKRLGR